MPAVLVGNRIAKKSPSPDAAQAIPRIFDASLGPGGGVLKHAAYTQAEAEDRRRSGRDIVVCRPDLASNRRLAQEIEQNANGRWKRCPPHPNAGPAARPHFQPDPRAARRTCVL